MNELKGFKELAKTLQTLESKTEQKIVRRGAAKMAQIVRKEMRAAAPKKTGNLRKNIIYKNKRVKSGGYQATVGAFGDGFYARFIEGGTKKHAIKAKKGKLSVKGKVYTEIQHPGQRKKPFLEPAFKRSQKRAMDEAGKLMFKLMSTIK